MKDIKIPSSVNSIERFAFNECYKLANIHIPQSVIKIDCPFVDCINLNSIYVEWLTPIKVDESDFEDVDKEKSILYIPKGTFQDYWFADVWGDFKNIVEYEMTNINETTTSSAVKNQSYYSTDGKHLKRLTKGINIIKYSDGSTKKVIVR